MTMPGEPGYPGDGEGTPVMTDLSNPDQHDSAAEPDLAPAGAGSRVAELEAELAQIRADALGGETVQLRVGPPHSAMTWGGITVGDQPVPVPARFLPGLQEAAANAGVDLIQEG